MAKKNKGSGRSAIAPIKKHQFIEVRIEKKGAMITCKAKTEDGVTENFIWNRKNQRNTVHTNAAPNVKVIVDSNVPANCGWDWDWKY